MPELGLEQEAKLEVQAFLCFIVLSVFSSFLSFYRGGNEGALRLEDLLDSHL